MASKRNKSRQTGVVSASKLAEKSLNYLYNLGERLIIDPETLNFPGTANSVMITADNLIDVLKRQGLHCSCHYVRGKPPCKCNTGNADLSGAGCRDKKGRFVPVSQCRRKRLPRMLI
jgi:hypothetical protein